MRHARSVLFRILFVFSFRDGSCAAYVAKNLQGRKQDIGDGNSFLTGLLPRERLFPGQIRRRGFFFLG
jgi:hypothetical protein